MKEMSTTEPEIIQTDPESESFRDHISTVDHRSGKRNWLYPKKPSGPFYRARTIVSVVLLAALFGMPFIKVNGNPLLLFNILERKFVIFGIVFTPQDLHLFALAMITLMVFIVLFTVVFGRLFCGWVCPQTIFMEMLFRKIEYWIEGNPSQQKKLNKAPWNQEKIIKKGGKTIIFYAIAVLIANTFLAYIIGIEEVLAIVTSPPAEHLQGFFTMLAFSGVFYFVFANMREQVCTTVCPYGRLQGVLLVKDSIVVAYDWVRGEPRGKIKKKAPAPQVPLGDCIDCTLCVQVCPTGIDIRNGTQLECVNCTACIDACDEVMVKINRPKGLIRYDSLSGIENKTKKLFTPRVIGYTGLLILLIALQGFLFATRSSIEVVVLRTPGMLYQEKEDNYISNLYNYQLVNKTNEDQTGFTFHLIDPPGRIQTVGTVPASPKQAMSEGAFFVEIPRTELSSRKNKITIEVRQGEEIIDRIKTNFLGPF